MVAACEGAMAADEYEVGPGPVRQKYSPCRFEVGASLVEACRGAIGIFSRVAACVEPAHPASGIFMGRNTGADRDHADAHVTINRKPVSRKGRECADLLTRMTYRAVTSSFLDAGTSGALG